MKIEFVYVPESITVGERFSAAVAISDDAGNPDPDFNSDSPCLLIADNVEADPVPFSCGEALFDAVLTARPSGSSSFFLKAVFKDLDEEAESEEIEVCGGEEGKDAALADEEVESVSELVRRLKNEKGKGMKTKHFLMLLKGRMWGGDNAQELVQCDAAGVLIDTLETCDSDEAVECIGALQELLGNVSGGAMWSCAACRSAIRLNEPQQQQQMDILVAPSGHAFHSSCFTCVQCAKPISTELFVRDENLRPYHSSCIMKEAPAWCKNQTPVSCEKLDLNKQKKIAEGGDDDALNRSNPCVADFMNTGKCERFASVLRARHWGDEYVRDRTKRMLLRVPVVVKKKIESLLS